MLAPDEVTELLFKRLSLLEQQIAAEQASLDPDGREVPRMFLIESDYELFIRKAEATWLRSLHDELTTGSFPGVEMWRSFEQTGEIPLELTELANRGSIEH